MILSILGGLAFVAAMFAALDARNARLDARQERRHAAADLRQVRELAELLGISVIPEPTAAEEDDAPAAPDPVEEEPARPRRYRGRRRRTWRLTLAGIRLAAREPFDISADWDAELAELTATTPTVAGVVEAEGLDDELATLTERELVSA